MLIDKHTSFPNLTGLPTSEAEEIRIWKYKLQNLAKSMLNIESQNAEEAALSRGNFRQILTNIVENV